MFLYNCFFFSSTGLRLIFFSKHNSNIFLPRLWHFGCWMNFLYFLLYWHLLSPISQPFVQFGLILKVIKCIEFQFIFFKMNVLDDKSKRIDRSENKCVVLFSASCTRMFMQHLWIIGYDFIPLAFFFLIKNDDS